jgi:hypothetical protein
MVDAAAQFAREHPPATLAEKPDTKSAAVSAALESVHTTEEARAILETLMDDAVGTTKPQ